MSLLKVEHADPAAGPIVIEQMVRNKGTDSTWDSDVAATHVVKFGEFVVIPVGCALRFIPLAELERRKRTETFFANFIARGTNVR